jgi:multidrug efflux pump subunit AcrB
LKKQAEKVSAFLQSQSECLWVRTSFDTPVAVANVELKNSESAALGINKMLTSIGIASGVSSMKISEMWEDNYNLPIVMEPANKGQELQSDKSGQNITDLQNIHIQGLLGQSAPLRQIASVTPGWEESVITHRNGIRSLSVLADITRGEYASTVFSKVENYVKSEIEPELPDNVVCEFGGAQEFEGETMSSMYLALVIALIMMFLILLFHFKKLVLAITIMLSATLSIFGAAFGVWVLKIDFSAFAILGIISLVGIIIRNGIIMYDYIEFLLFVKQKSVFDAAFEAGKRRMRPIFLTSAAASMGVLPMIISQSPMWAGMAAIIFFGTLISMLLLVTVLPVVYLLIYKNKTPKSTIEYQQQ